MNDYEVLATDFSQVGIDNYDPTVWTPEEVMARDPQHYGVLEPESQEVSQDIIDIVKEQREQAESSGAEFYNGPLIRVQEHEVDDGKLKLDIQNTNYFSHVGTRKRPELVKEDRADPLSVGAHLITSDNYLVLGERSGLVELGGGEYQLAGAGFIEDPELQYERSLNAQPSSPIHREIEEEVNLDQTQITGPVPSALIGAVHKQPMLIYETETVLDSEEVRDEWLEIDQDEKEFSELLFLPEEDITQALEGKTDVLIADNEGIKNERYEGELRPHARGAIETLN